MSLNIITVTLNMGKNFFHFTALLYDCYMTCYMIVLSLLYQYFKELIDNMHL